MEITPLSQTLIFIEDKKSAQISELKFLKQPILRGILGKMEAMKLIEKQNGQLKVSKIGQKYLNSILDNLHKKTIHWDGKWRFVSFSLPETKRPLRDKFRRILELYGFKMILTGLWISPLDLTQDIYNEAKNIGISKNIILIESEKILTGMSEVDLQKLWQFDVSRSEIYAFINEAEDLIAKKNLTSFEVKKIIFAYATILGNQPKLPIELFPKDWPQYRANLLYRKLKRMISQRA